MMLETIEQRCLEFLTHSERPLVSLDRLLLHVREDPACASLTRAALLEFLERHELFRVVAPPALPAEALDQLEGQGFPVSVQVVLAARVPGSTELARTMRDQVRTLLDALDCARQEAAEANDARRAKAAETLAARAAGILNRLDAVLGGPSDQTSDRPS